MDRIRPERGPYPVVLRGLLEGYVCPTRVFFVLHQGHCSPESAFTNTIGHSGLQYSYVLLPVDM